jgi:putative endopeptidase
VNWYAVATIYIRSANVKTRLFAMTLAALAGCGSSKPATTTTTPPAAEASTVAPEATPAPAKPKASIGAWGFDEAGMDKSAAPGESFFRYANGTWLKTTQIPPDKSNYGMFTALADRSEERTKTIIETAQGPAGSDGQRIGDYYKTFMDEAAIEALGLAPLKPMLDDIAKITNPAGVVAQFAAATRRMGESPFRIDVQQDARDPESYLPDLGQGGIGLPDRDMYDTKAKQFDAVRAGYKQYIAQMFTLLGFKDAEKRAAAVYALEEKIARAHWTRLQNRDPQKTYNKMSIAQLQKAAPGIDWTPLLKSVGLDGQPAINVNQPSAITAIAALVKSQPLAVWKDYLALQLAGDAADFLPKAFVDLHFDMFGKRLSGTLQIQERWKRAVAFTTRQMGEAVGALYVAKYFTPETKAHADQLVKNLLVSMGQRLDGLAWMGAETKTKAKEKLATYNPKIGFPKKWRDYSALKIVPGDAVGNVTRAAEFEYNRRLAKIGKPVDRDEWGMTPMTVNAYYNPVLNEIVFPAAILQPPFFDVNADDAVNYGGIGAVIGHEISHGFDDQGSQFDAKGTLKNWWTKEDNDKFKVATAKLIAQYDAYCPVPASEGKPAQCVKGALTLGENIADLAGLTIAYNAYKLSLGGKPAPVINGVTGDQRFFLGWAQVWRRIYRDQEYANRLVTDVHSPAEFRVSVVRNLDPWYDAFQPKETDALYLPADKRVKIW